MIITVGSSLPSFRTITFHSGLNILLADESEISTEKQTRNSAGKSSIIEIVHFLLGGDITQGTPFVAKALARTSFWGEFNIAGTKTKVTRHVNMADRVYVEFDSQPETPLVQEGDLIEPYTSVRNWNAWLGHVMFRLPLQREKTVFEDGGPTFRMLLPYFARRRGNGGFLHPAKAFEKAPDPQAQTALSYMMGLDWTIVRAFDEAKQAKKEIDADAKNAIRANPSLTTLASVTAEHVLAQQRAARLSQQIADFQVEEHYHDLMKEVTASRLQAERLTREEVQYATGIKHIEASIENEKRSTLSDVERLYDAVGFQLPDSVRIGFESVAAFHESVVTNRKFHLSQELERNRQRLREIDAERRSHTTRQSEIYQSLKGKGAFGELVDMQRRLAEVNQQVATLAMQKGALQKAESNKSEHRKERINLKQRLDADLAAREKAVRDATLAVNEALNALYEADRNMSLRIESTETGPRFIVHIDGSRSGGIANMEIFAMDYALFKLVSTSFGGPHFLIHDSHLFDGVDSRQVATALEIGGDLAHAVAGQYIVTMNSDLFKELPFTEGFDAKNHVLPVVLGDTTTGGLFGFRFE
ncbi:DUF2326 domain-containing protein [Rhizobium sp. B230/85]|uniref:ABC-three component system protein n=1 Tax=unclassified Rhizobium TaxID=2613769 RepID=UPI001ADD1300|nr:MULTISPECIES: ABC-three component system protein [unclassified Rhizobium]MBO9133579.1 DUF2326 domain-containing protein [Rhizobium sp. B209b/85]QXZ97258.1 DUF2326 domain-containing protein [Rhizobium sp. B230/85]